MNGDQCTYLHYYEFERMKECPNGANCDDWDCVYRHVAEEERPECPFYTQGFCPNGAQCRFLHVKKDASHRPELADREIDRLNLVQQKKRKEASAEAQHAKRLTEQGRGALFCKFDLPQGKNELYKTSLCRNWVTYGECRNGDNCDFAHGEAELREHPKQQRARESGKRGSARRQATGSIASWLPNSLIAMAAHATSSPTRRVPRRLPRRLRRGRGRGPLMGAPPPPQRWCAPRRRPRARTESR